MNHPPGFKILPEAVQQVGYTNYQHIGFGSFGAVYSAQRPDHANVALKILCVADSTQRGSENLNSTTNVEKEIRFMEGLSKLNSRHLLTLYRVHDYRFQDTRFVVLETELCKCSLSDYLSRHGPLNEEQARLTTIQIIDGLSALHNASLVHRDLSPKNVLLSRKHPYEPYSIRLADFGLARLLEDKSLIASNMGDCPMTVAGTPLYMAPEVAFQNYTLKIDIWSVGCLVFFMLTGAHLMATFRDLALNFQLLNSLKKRMDIRPILEEIQSKTHAAIDNLAASPIGASRQVQNFLRLTLNVRPLFRLSLPEAAINQWLLGAEYAALATEASGLRMEEVESFIGTLVNPSSAAGGGRPTAPASTSSDRSAAAAAGGAATPAAASAGGGPTGPHVPGASASRSSAGADATATATLAGSGTSPAQPIPFPPLATGPGHPGADAGNGGVSGAGPGHAPNFAPRGRTSSIPRTNVFRDISSGTSPPTHFGGSAALIGGMGSHPYTAGGGMFHHQHAGAPQGPPASGVADPLVADCSAGAAGPGDAAAPMATPSLAGALPGGNPPGPGDVPASGWPSTPPASSPIMSHGDEHAYSGDSPDDGACDPDFVAIDYPGPEAADDGGVASGPAGRGRDGSGDGGKASGMGGPVMGMPFGSELLLSHRDISRIDFSSQYIMQAIVTMERLAEQCLSEQSLGDVGAEYALILSHWGRVLAQKFAPSGGEPDHMRVLGRINHDARAILNRVAPSAVDLSASEADPLLRCKVFAYVFRQLARRADVYRSALESMLVACLYLDAFNIKRFPQLPPGPVEEFNELVGQFLASAIFRPGSEGIAGGSMFSSSVGSRWANGGGGAAGSSLGGRG
ncbi:ULK protein kinase [Fonticula alba]|uniref:ULK protein kinase n=1 Tax=Fonticula alba TaxID=691883 RepID=A0A058Z3Y6_FONAL|nr:ULK protein kinase [Fonticula alba]KCV68969.1 ULK protein kinase [Fonticula alba]|eukprot:XP_009496540.1 ULK protein kinase [Fonticula alba]